MKTSHSEPVEPGKKKLKKAAKKGRPRSAGNRHGWRTLYYDWSFPRNKLRRILRRWGLAVGELKAREWLQNRGKNFQFASQILERLLKERKGRAL